MHYPEGAKAAEFVFNSTKECRSNICRLKLQDGSYQSEESLFFAATYAAIFFFTTHTQCYYDKQMLPHSLCSSWILCEVTCWALSFESLLEGFNLMDAGLFWDFLWLYEVPAQISTLRAKAPSLRKNPLLLMSTDCVNLLVSVCSEMWHARFSVFPNECCMCKSYGWLVNWVLTRFIFRQELTNLLCTLLPALSRLSKLRNTSPSSQLIFASQIPKFSSLLWINYHK